jgi:hypothetical protein
VSCRADAVVEAAQVDRIVERAVREVVAEAVAFDP